MHTPLHSHPPARFKKNPLGGYGTRLLALLAFLLGSTGAWAQISGPKTIGPGGDYATVAAAIAALNAGGVGGGGVTFNVPADYTETFASPTAGRIQLAANPSTAANPIIFQKSGTGANPKLTATSTATGPQDAIISLVGTDYVTFDGIDVADPAAGMEFGYALFRASATDGCQNNTIQNATITLSRTNVATVGIWGANTTATATTAVASTSADGANSNNKINGNTVTNSFAGIYFLGSTLASGFLDIGNEIGTTAGNTVSNIGSGAGTATIHGIRGENQNNLKVENNTITIPANYSGTGTLQAISLGSSATTGLTGTLLIHNNTITIASASTGTITGIRQAGTSGLTTVSITNNKLQNFALTGATGAVYFIDDNHSGAANTTTITGNQIIGNSVASNTTSYYGIYRSGTSGTANISGNYIGVTPGGVASPNVRTSTGGTTYFIRATTGTITVSGNFIQHNSFTVSGTASTSVYGYYNIGTPASQTITGNTITDLSTTGTNTATGHVLTGIHAGSLSTGTKTISNNTIGRLTIGSAGNPLSGTVTGINQQAGAADINQNKIHDLTAHAASGAATGILLTSGTTLNAANNLIGNLLTPASLGTLAVSGITVATTTGGAAVSLFFNTIYLNGTGGSSFGSSGIYLSSTSAPLDARNNIVVNTSTAGGGTGSYTVAFRRALGTAGSAPTNYAASSNNNLFFAGTPSALNLIYAEGTTAQNAQQTLTAYKTFMSTRDQQAVTENPPFISTAGTSPDFLHIATGTPTQVESGGVAGTGITIDYDNQSRNSPPDIGADEGTFTASDMSAPSIVYTALTNSGNTTSRTLTATITDPSDVAGGANAPLIYYRKGTSGAYVSAPATSVSGSSYTFTIDYASIGGVAPGDVIQYYVAAQDVPGNAGTSPGGGSGANPPGTTAPTNPNQYTILTTLAGTYYISVDGTPDDTRRYTTLTAAAAAYNASALGGPVTFLLMDVAYPSETYPIVFNANAEASSTNTLTIKPNTGITTSFTSGATSSAVIQLNGADYITIDGSNTVGGTTRDLTLTSGNTATASAVVWVTSLGTGAGATFNTLKNLNIIGGSPTLSSSFGVYAAGTTLSTSGTGAGNDNLTVQNNAISRAYSGIHARGVASTGLLETLLIEGNLIGSATAANTVTFRGVDVTNATAPIVRLNRIEGMTTTATVNISAIDLGINVTNALVSRNFITNLRSTAATGYGAYGINISSGTTTNIEISNNIISDVLTFGDNSSSGSFNPFGIRITGGSGHKLYFNSVSMTGAMLDASGDGGLSAALLVTSGTLLDVRNNIFLNSQTGETGTKVYAMYVSATTPFATINYNDYFVSGPNGVLANVTTDRATLTELQAGTGQDANSISADPQFDPAATTPLTPTSAALNETGVTISTPTTTIDFTGATRTSPPDMGAVEFTPSSLDLGAVALVTPSATGCYSANETVTVRIQNLGLGTIDFATNNATISGSVSGAATQTFGPVTLTSGTLAPNAFQDVVIGTVNMTAAGTYTFNATAGVTGEGNTTNNDFSPVTRTQNGVATLPQLLDFTGLTSTNLSTLYPGWYEATGTTTPTGTTSNWINDDFANVTGGPNGTAAKINLDAINETGWIVSPRFTATATTLLSFDLALTTFGNTTANVLDGDDLFEVRISTDCGATFTSVRTFNSTTTISNTGQTELINLSAYDGQEIIVAFFATEGATVTGDIDLFLDNVNLRDAPANDAGVVAIIDPVMPFTPTSQNVSVQVKNFGFAVLNSVTVNFTVNGIAQTPQNFTNLNLASGATSGNLSLGTFDFSVGGPSFTIVATTSAPNGGTDADTNNDSFTRTVTPSLSGLYTVGTLNTGGTRNFLTLDEAANTLNEAGAIDAVTFSLTDATYPATSGITINQFSGNSSSNTLTIKPAAGITPVLTTTAAATFLLKLNGTDYVTIDGSNTVGGTTRDLTLTSANTTAGSAVVWLVSLGTNAGATYNTVKNVNINGGNATSTTSFGVYAAGTTLSTSGTGAGNDNLTVQNNAISRAYSGIHARGVASTGLLETLLIEGNLIGSATNTVAFRGVDVTNATAPIVRLNRIEGMTTTATVSISAIDLGINVTNALVSRNFISNLRSTNTSGYGAYGIQISSTTGTAGNEISNNIISDILTDGDGTSTLFNPFGIRLAGGTGTKVYYNSVNLAGAFTTTSSTVAEISAALIVTTSSVTGLDLRNNILVNGITGGGAGTKSYALYATTAASFAESNYNDYFVSGLNGVLGRVGTSDVTTLDALKTSTTKDASSINGDPGFTSATNLMPNPADPNSYHLNGTGTHIATVSQDFEGNARPTTVAAGAPDLGAYEFTPTAQPNVLTTTGTFALGGTQDFFFAGRRVATIVYGNTGTLPTTLTARYFPGTNPRNPQAAKRYMNSFLELVPSADGSDFTYDLTLFYDDALLGTVDPESALRLSRRDPATGNFQFYDQSTVDATANTLSQTGLTAFGEFTGSDQAAPLPVTITSFDAKRDGSTAVVTWTTAMEKNSKGYEIQVSSDSRTFRTLGFVPSESASSSSARAYRFLDTENGKQGIRYYRLKQIDLDGTAAYIGPRSVTFEGATAKLDAAPNPFQSEVTLTLQARTENKDARLVLLDATGRVVREQSIQVPAGASSLTLSELSGLPAGVYVLRLTLDGKLYHSKLVKE
ncbi:T9SS type A sorting domain-containing protein [Hymenobacter sp. BT175]|uniref:T9SS type A sorting domain-containing protein n=1 Tax=Hymenobacter translucens TaxID=2886507 RepID=UPI001D0E21C3|nr:T9SS type A sorting domain-containing protein [Hymenobacter translucens]MCC2546062.1 T9SS type A sorting domain-containing protein [Hymenobacter translucens]